MGINPTNTILIPGASRRDIQFTVEFQNWLIHSTVRDSTSALSGTRSRTALFVVKYRCRRQPLKIYSARVGVLLVYDIAVLIEPT